MKCRLASRRSIGSGKRKGGPRAAPLRSVLSS
jgi:hypothetical protein